MHGKLLISGLSALLLAGCADYQLVAYDPEQNYLSYNHRFTDKAAADILASAKKLCAQKKQAAVQTSNTCSLEQCTTNYQCVNSPDVVKDGL